MDEAVQRQEERKLRARRQKDRTLRQGLAVWGVVGWSVAVPTLAGALVGLWLDREVAGPFPWALTLLLAGLALGCAQAWRWVAREQREMGPTEPRDEGD
jgi:ATP synthase protein I